MSNPEFSVRPDRVGRSLTHLCGGALALCLLMVIGLLALLAYQGLRYFWPGAIAEIDLKDGRKVIGEVVERVPVRDASGERSKNQFELRIKSGNRDLTGRDFEWVREDTITSLKGSPDLMLFEREEWGNFYGKLLEIRRGKDVLAQGSKAAFPLLREILESKESQRKRIEALDKGERDDVNYAIRKLEWERRDLERQTPEKSPKAMARMAEIEQERSALFGRADAISRRMGELRTELLAEVAIVQAADGQTKEISIGTLVRAIMPNGMSTWERLKLYFARAFEFVADDPRESNTEGGIFPAIFGTVLMVLLMAIFVVPLGVLAALYLREYAKQGPVVRIVRIAVNNLAGTPSIVFGVFGLGFFVHLCGGTIDSIFYPERLPEPTFGTGGVLWAALTLSLLTVPVVIVATEEGLAAVPRIVREGSLALGATKWETIRRVVLPASTPAILTGMILAMGRAAGEVAPLMIVGMVKLADLPIDHHPPYLHLDGKFMHLGFHIYDVGLQSPNIEATKPIVSATAFLLIAVVTTLNLFAISVRNRLRKKYAQSGV